MSVVFQQGAGLINHRLTAGDAFRDGEAMIPGGPFTFPQCLFSGLNQGRQQFSRDGHLAVFAHVIDDLHRHAGRNTGFSPLVFRDVLQARQDGSDFMIGQGNIHSVSEVILRLWAERLKNVDDDSRDAKTALQEWAQAQGMSPPRYVQVARSGPDHAPEFEIAVRLDDGRQAMATGKGTKRSIEQAAAQALLDQIEGST